MAILDARPSDPTRLPIRRYDDVDQRRQVGQYRDEDALLNLATFVGPGASSMLGMLMELGMS